MTVGITEKRGDIMDIDVIIQWLIIVIWLIIFAVVMIKTKE